jgi:hypothetical protein
VTLERQAHGLRARDDVRMIACGLFVVLDPLCSGARGGPAVPERRMRQVFADSIQCVSIQHIGNNHYVFFS